MRPKKTTQVSLENIEKVQKMKNAPKVSFLNLISLRKAAEVSLENIEEVQKMKNAPKVSFLNPISRRKKKATQVGLENIEKVQKMPQKFKPDLTKKKKAAEAEQRPLL